MRPLVADLGLAGDGDDSDIIRDLEHSLGISFGAGPLDCTTVGDIEARLLALYPASKTPALAAQRWRFVVFAPRFRRRGASCIRRRR